MKKKENFKHQREKLLIGVNGEKEKTSHISQDSIIFQGYTGSHLKTYAINHFPHSQFIC